MSPTIAIALTLCAAVSVVSGFVVLFGEIITGREFPRTSRLQSTTLAATLLLFVLWCGVTA